jgi:peroxiredoxin Q/BCP
VTKKKLPTRKPSTAKKVAPKKKVASKKKVVARKKAARPKSPAAKVKGRATTTARVEAKPKTPRPVAQIAPAALVVKRTKSRLIKAGMAVAGGQASATMSEPPPEGAAAKLLQVGQQAPDFRLPADDGRIISLSDFRGKKVVLYFYPKDDTPGCTKEACSFRDGLAAIEQRNTVVLGISVDSIDSHEVFHEKFGLNFPLLSDELKETVEAYGVWTEKSFQGRTWMATDRTTFIIDEEGKIARVFPKVQVDGHFEEVLAAL